MTQACVQRQAHGIGRVVETPEAGLPRVLHGGEEHAMLATFPPEAVPEGFRAIGQVRDAAGETDHGVLLDGAQIPGTGFDHFEGKA